MLKLAFASSDRTRVNQHFGAAEGFVIYEATPASRALVAVGDFPAEAMDGNEDKLAAKVDFLQGCDAVFVMAIGASAIKQLLAANIQPIRIVGSDRIDELLEEVQQAMQEGGVPWVDRALSRRKSGQRFDAMEEEGWTG